ncbi:MAG: PVC-type heme-binding CxxCH protein [Verrucomicrobiota bacterium]
MYSRFGLAHLLLMLHVVGLLELHAATNRTFRAGAVAVDISPEKFPVFILGNFLEATSRSITDALYARCLVLDDGAIRIALAVVDSCMVPRELLDEAKLLAQQRTGIPTDRILISATHTHTAPAAMGGLGCRVDLEYARTLPPKIAEAIFRATQHLEPARIGWAVTNDWEHTHNRRWIYRSDKMLTDPFGNRSVRANMHPGYRNPDAIGPSGPVDPGLTVLSVQSRAGRPIAILANYSMHYFGSTPVSADYFGKFAEKIRMKIGATNSAPPFVGMMSQGTSGDLMWMNYGKAQKAISLEDYSEAVTQVAFEAYQTIRHRDWAPLAMAESKLALNRRVPDDARLAWAREIIAKMGDAPTARNLQEVYAKEAIYLHEEPRRELKLQAVRIGDLGITALPNEVYAITGLKLKALSPLRPTFNIELANGAEGYIPTPEQHKLGGYTTWPARTAGLEPEAEPKIVETLLALLERVSGQSRRQPLDSDGGYAKAVLESKPSAFWRLGDFVGPHAREAKGRNLQARYTDGVAFHLEGPNGKGFAAADDINRCVHLAGGTFRANLPPLRKDYTVEFWFWNGLPASARETTAFLFSDDEGDRLFITGTKGAPGRLAFSSTATALNASVTGPTELLTKTWYHVALVRTDRAVRVFLNGNATPEIGLQSNLIRTSDSTTLVFGGTKSGEANLEGKLDEVAVYHRALKADEISVHFKAGGLIASPSLGRSLPDTHGPYAKALLDLKPLVYWRMSEIDFAQRKPIDATGREPSARLEEDVEFAIEGPLTEAFSGAAQKNLAAQFAGGRLKSVVPGLERSSTFSVAFWFWNDLPNNARPVTGYLFSRGRDGSEGAPGDHLGIGGTHLASATGRLIFFNGNRLDQLVAGVTVIEPRTWNHVVLVRDGRQVRAFLNGNAEPELSGEAEPGYEPGSNQIFIGGRNDNFANFQGRIDEATVFDRVLTPDEIAALYRASAMPLKERRAAQPASTRATFDAPPRSAEESRRAWRVREGFEIELLAAEPLVQSPVAIDWDAAGRLWVVEMLDYPMGIDGKMKPGGRVKILEDANADGQFDRATVFLDGLNFPNGILTWRDGALITAAPEILFAADTDGDGRADKREVLYSGFKEGNLQLRVNGLRWGLDQWIYCANGWSGGVARSLRTGQSIDLNGRDLRIKPDQGMLEQESGVSQFGRNRNSWGDWFGVNNSYPLWHYVMAERYARRNPEVTLPEPLVQLMLPANPKIYPVRPPEKRFHNFHESGRFTSACSTMIYQDELLFERASGAVPSVEHVFVCEPFHQVVHHEWLEESGVSFTARRPPGEETSEFLASEDRWSRPVMARTGPDGALWIVDMYRYMIEHPDWLPPEGKAAMEPFFRAGAELGRIYRVFPKGKRPQSWPGLASLPAKELADSLKSSNGWVRDKAHQMLLWRADKSIAGRLEQIARTAARPESRVQALGVLEGLDALDAELVRAALGDSDTHVRRTAVRLAERFAPAPGQLLAAFERLAGDSPKIRLQLAFSLGEFSQPEAGKHLARLAIENAAEKYIRAAVLTSAGPHLEKLVAALTADSDAFDLYHEPLLQMAVARNDQRALAQLVHCIFSPRTSTATFTERDLKRFATLLSVLGRKNIPLQTLAAGDNSLARALQKSSDLFAHARRLAGGSIASENEAERLAAVALLGHEAARREDDLDLLQALIHPRESIDLQRAAVRAIAKTGDATVPARLTNRAPGCGPEVMATILDQLLSREGWTIELIERMQRGQLIGILLDAARRERLLKHSSEQVRTLARAALKNAPNQDRAVVLEQFRPALALKGNVRAGAEVFGRLCASCHRIDEVGRDIGPNLRSASGHTPEKLLIAILDPSREIEPRFVAYECTLTNGEELFGIVASESGSSLTFTLVDGSTRSILRREIQALRSTKSSLMPEGLETGLTPQALADLIEFVRGETPHGYLKQMQAPVGIKPT